MIELGDEKVVKEITIPELPLKLKVDLRESQPYSKECLIDANNDLEAIGCWLKNYVDTPKTFEAYRRQTRLFLMWCVYECGKSLISLKAQDFEDYLDFLRAPPQHWCASRAELRGGLNSPNWRPLVGSLSPSAIQTAFRILQSLIGYLNDSDYLKSNPLKLVKLNKGYSQTYEEQKYQVWARMLEEDEWKALQETLEELPEGTDLELGYKLRAQFLVALLYFLGLRIHEVAAHTWKAFQFREGKWWFFVKGKGGKLGHIPVHEKLLGFAKLYRIYLKKVPLPGVDEDEPILLTLNQKPLQIRQAYNLIKKLGNLAAIKLKDEPHKANKLKKLSPHWLRHLSASHQDKAGISATMIKENLRHGSSQTTQIYLHAEEKFRHEAMQKMSLKVDIKSIPNKVITNQTIFSIYLSKGPVNKALGFKGLLEALENDVFTVYQWQHYQFEKLEKIKEIETSILFSQNIKFSYIFKDLSNEKIGELTRIIRLEANIRLFDTEIEIN